MSYSFDREMIKLRMRVTDAAKAGVYDSPAEQALHETLVTNMLAEAEAKRREAEAVREDHLRQAEKAMGAAEAFKSLGSMLFAQLDGMIRIKQKQIEEAQRREAEKAASEATDRELEAGTESPAKKKQKRKE